MANHGQSLGARPQNLLADRAVPSILISVLLEANSTINYYRVLVLVDSAILWWQMANNISCNKQYIIIYYHLCLSMIFCCWS